VGEEDASVMVEDASEVGEEDASATVEDASAMIALDSYKELSPEGRDCKRWTWWWEERRMCCGSGLGHAGKLL
jgi:hypothetical protein